MKYVLPIIWIVFCVLFFRSGLMQEATLQASDIKAGTSFIEEFNSDKLSFYKIQKDNVHEPPYGNLVVNNLAPGFRSDMEMHANQDGSITLNGTFLKESGTVVFSPDHMRLDAGVYSIYAEGVPRESSDCKIVFGTNPEDSINYTMHEISQDPGERYTLTIDSPCYCVYGVYLNTDYHAEDVTLRLMISPDAAESYLACPVKYYEGSSNMLNYCMFYTDKDLFKSFSDWEYTLLSNNMQYQYTEKYAWCTIDFGDGTGIQFLPESGGKGIYGRLDALERVITTDGYFCKTENGFEIPF